MYAAANSFCWPHESVTIVLMSTQNSFSLFCMAVPVRPNRTGAPSARAARLTSERRFLSWCASSNTTHAQSMPGSSATRPGRS